MKRVLLVSLVTTLALTACTTETTTEEVLHTSMPTVEIMETTTVTEPVVEETTEPTIVEETTEEVTTTYLGEFLLTAYCPCESCCGQWADGITATGTTAVAGKTIAVDPTVIPYGTEVIINGNTYLAEDCGGAIKGNRIDIYFDTHGEALEFGVQYADVYIVRS